jgi:SAM-dependent methyltransferase
MIRKDGFDLSLFDKSADYYDVIYDAVGKNYLAESKRLRQLIRLHKKSKGNTLLDVACGTGRHVSYLKSSYSVEGLDLNRRLLTIAKRRNPNIHFHRANMLAFNLHRQFDVVTCLFSAIGYMTTVHNLRRAVRNMSLHVKPGGVLIIEPWVTPRDFIKGKLRAVFVDEIKLKIARIDRSTVRGHISTLDFQYLIATPRDTQYFTEREKFGLFTHSEYANSIRLTGLKVVYYAKGLIGRGLYVGVKPKS